ncbi:MAG TPA: hypothetical protein VJT15_03455 [Pyrinomonadaceae bacterium]|nr:hypothetical protein [Pyrinomonadaceae bacterium]
MNNVGQSGDKKSYRVILLLVVGLTAFSSAMKELNQLRDFARDAGTLMASLSNALTPSHPAEKLAPIDVPRTAVRLEACDSVNVHAPEAAEQQVQVDVGVAPAARVEQGARAEIKDVGKTVVARRNESRTERRELNIAALPKHRVDGIEMIELRRQARRLADLKFTIVADDENEAEIAIPGKVDLKVPKVKNHRQIIINTIAPDALKNLNRSLNLRSAG